MPRTSERGGPQTRAKILDVAITLFLDRGYDNVTVAEVARAAGVSSVTVFKHFPRKEDLFLDRADDAAALLRSAIGDRDAGVTIVASLQDAISVLADTAHPLSGLDERSVAFLRTVAGSAALIARARQIGAELQAVLTEELQQDDAFEGDSALLAAFFINGYASVLVETARRRIAGDPLDKVATDHRARLEALVNALIHGFGARS